MNKIIIMNNSYTRNISNISAKNKKVNKKHTIYILNLFKVVDEYKKNDYSYKLEPNKKDIDNKYLYGQCKWFDLVDKREIDIVIERSDYEIWKNKKN
jgi:hypothetical protein